MVGFPYARVTLGGESIATAALLKLRMGQYERPNVWFSFCEGDSGR